MTRVAPVHTMREALASGEAVRLVALHRDAPFFRDWRRGPADGLPTRVTNGWRARIALPLPPGSAYDLIVRVDSSHEPMRPGDVPAEIHILMNGRVVSRCEPGGSPERIGTCRVRVPADAVREDLNQMTLTTDYNRAPGFRVWYIHIQRSAP